MDRRPVVGTHRTADRRYRRRQIDFEMGAPQAIYHDWGHYISLVSAPPRVYGGHYRLFRGRQEVRSAFDHLGGCVSHCKLFLRGVGVFFLFLLYAHQ